MPAVKDMRCLYDVWTSADVKQTCVDCLPVVEVAPPQEAARAQRQRQQGRDQGQGARHERQPLAAAPPLRRRHRRGAQLVERQQQHRHVPRLQPHICTKTPHQTPSLPMVSQAVDVVNGLSYMVWRLAPLQKSSKLTSGRPLDGAGQAGAGVARYRREGPRVRGYEVDECERQGANDGRRGREEQQEAQHVGLEGAHVNRGEDRAAEADKSLQDTCSLSQFVSTVEMCAMGLACQLAGIDHPAVMQRWLTMRLLQIASPRTPDTSSLPTTEPRWRGKLRTLVTMAAVSTQPLPDSPTTASVTTCTVSCSAISELSQMSGGWVALQHG
jgi:hypothetical protein